MDFYGVEYRVFKANLHTHSTVSDGRFGPQEVIRLYADHGYDALAFTDHRRTNPVGSYDARGMALLSGIELHPAGPRGVPWHLLAIGVPEGFPGEFASGQEAVDAVNAAGGAVFAAHPYWSGFTSAEIMSLIGLAGIEVYNTSTRYIGKAYNMQLWDEILDAGRRCPAIAVDDMHRCCDLFRGWTMIAAEEGAPGALLDALKAGRFYASQGPEIHTLSLRGNVFEAEFSPCVEAILVAPGSRGFCGAVPDADGPGSPEKEVTGVRFELGDTEPRYVRLQIRDRAGRHAWSCPVGL
ncbi:MAG: CehA/McbA family metallohydrolase [Lentisphaeria bacterium]|nr:CehA/McbA family metallohydrolase [Lentisphaeria bacterium]